MPPQPFTLLLSIQEIMSTSQGIYLAAIDFCCFPFFSMNECIDASKPLMLLTEPCFKM